MNRIAYWCVVAAMGLGAAHPVSAQELFVYPAKGQSPEQQEKDKFECYGWAKANTGFDPANPGASAAPSAAAPPPPPRSGGVARGALGGAAIGAIASDDSSEGAARGAAAGALFGGIRQGHANRQALEQQQQQQAAAPAAGQADYNRAYAACLEARGYTVK